MFPVFRLSKEKKETKAHLDCPVYAVKWVNLDVPVLMEYQAQKVMLALAHLVFLAKRVFLVLTANKDDRVRKVRRDNLAYQAFRVLKEIRASPVSLVRKATKAGLDHSEIKATLAYLVCPASSVLLAKKVFSVYLAFVVTREWVVYLVHLVCPVRMDHGAHLVTEESMDYQAFLAFLELKATKVSLDRPVKKATLDFRVLPVYLV